MVEKKPTWERVVLFLFPTIELEGTLWQSLWREERRQGFKLRMKIVCLVTAIAYALHYFLVEGPANAQPAHLWKLFRFGTAGLFFGGFLAAQFTKFIQESRFYWLPYTLLGFYISYMQSQAMLWDSRVPFVFAIVLPVIMVMVFAFSILPSILFLGLTYVAIFPNMAQALAADPEGVRTIISGFNVGITTVAFLRSGFAKDVQTFIRRQELIQERQKVIEGQKELTDQLKGFVPAEIFGRIITLNRRHRLSMVQAMDEVIRPRKKVVACIHSDIRSFTLNSKNLDTYLLDRAIPNIRLMTEIAESRRGISRLVGDLILTYFDQDNPTDSLLLAMECGFEISARNEQFNSGHDVDFGIKRNVIVSFGTCIVGNIGAVNHAREITTLGPPVNLINRIDALVKNNSSSFGVDLNHSVILTKQAADVLQTAVPGLLIAFHDLPKLGLAVRDFPEETMIASVTTAPEARELIRTAIQNMKPRVDEDELQGSQGRRSDRGEYANGELQLVG